MSLYQPLEVIQTYSKIFGLRYFVRDEEESHLFNLVEYVGNPGRLTCYCPDGQAHAEAPDVEPPCTHLRAVCDERMATQQSSRPAAPIAISALID